MFWKVLVLANAYNKTKTNKKLEESSKKKIIFFPAHHAAKFCPQNKKGYTKITIKNLTIYLPISRILSPILHFMCLLLNPYYPSNLVVEHNWNSNMDIGYKWLWFEMK